jgi:hypothetical protein
LGGQLKVLAIDASLNNVGLCIAEINGKQVNILKIELISLKRQGKHKSKADAERVKIISARLRYYCKGVDLIMAELPSGSINASGAWSLGCAVGIVGSLPKPIIWVSPLEVKKVVHKKASKREMIDWATTKFPDLDWIRYRGRITNQNEHVSDACAVIFAALPKIPKI